MGRGTVTSAYGGTGSQLPCRENHADSLYSIVLGAVMLMPPNILGKPVLWLSSLIAGVLTGPIATSIEVLMHEKINDRIGNPQTVIKLEGFPIFVR